VLRIAKLKERRELQRLERQAQKEAEQQRKVQQAIERARKPIPRKFRRAPIVERIIPLKGKVRSSEQAILKRIEEERLERLLFEDDD
jgi:hypothetical protein